MHSFHLHWKLYKNYIQYYSTLDITTFQINMLIYVYSGTMIKFINLLDLKSSIDRNLSKFDDNFLTDLFERNLS